MSFLPPEQSNYSNRDRLLPSQPLMRQFFSGSDFIGALASVTNSVLPVQSVAEKFDIRLKPGMTYETLGSDLSTLHFLQILVRLSGAKNVLEVGTYIGVSTMFLAEALGDAGHVFTVEAGAEFFELAKENFERNGLTTRITQYHANVGAIVEGLAWYVHPDMIFLDGDKANYGRLLPRLLKLLRPGGLLLVDDVYCQGDALNPEPTTDKGLGVRDLLRRVAELGSSYSPVILPYGNGLLLLRKPT